MASLKQKNLSSSSHPVLSQRYFVPDLSPQFHQSLLRIKPKYVFVAESPHIHEVTPQELAQRRPLCGAAGKKWWGELSELLEGRGAEELSLEYLLKFCSRHRVVILNAVQFPLDPKVSQEFPEADPIQNLGFNKVSGQYSFKKLKDSDVVIQRIEDLSQRLNHPSIRPLEVHCLGNDSEWFVKRALSRLGQESRFGIKIPHPSARWRKGGYYGDVAQTQLKKMFQV